MSGPGYPVRSKNCAHLKFLSRRVFVKELSVILGRGVESKDVFGGRRVVGWCTLITLPHACTHQPSWSSYCPIVVSEHPTQPFAALNLAGRATDFAPWKNDLVSDTLVVTFRVLRQTGQPLSLLIVPILTLHP